MRQRKHAGGARLGPSKPFASILEARLSRRHFLAIGGIGAAAAFLGCARAPGPGRVAAATIGFTGIPPATDDTVRVPPGYRARVLIAWGDPISEGPAFRSDAGNSAAEQAQQFGMHADGMHFFPLPGRQDAGLLAVNHEYTDEGLLHPDGAASRSAEKVAKSQAAHGVSIVEIERADGGWRVLRPSRYARRITATTPLRLSGPAAGHALLVTAADPSGRLPLGTLANCAAGLTPWGTYLSCEENWHGYFARPEPPARPEREGGSLLAGQARYGIEGTGAGYDWHEFDARFNASAHPHEPHRFGWVVEIDPYDPGAMPVKRTALGRIKHEGATVTLARDGRVVVYLGDDERFEYLYKYISRAPFRSGAPEENGQLLDDGTLYVARFFEDGGGVWLPLEHGRHGLTAENGFRDQAEVLIYTRLAADRAGATPMDRPEWIAVHPDSREVYCALTNNERRGAPGAPPSDGPNPRASNHYGHILRWREAGSDAAALAFAWDVFILCGDPQSADPEARGDVRGDHFGSPDGLWFDPRGVLWIQTDVASKTIDRGPYRGFGNNQMLAAEIRTGEVRRFLTGPRGCEVTGVTMSPDGRTLFVNIQHPGEPGGGWSDPADPKAVSGWPEGEAGGRPRSATLAIQKDGGGLIGT